MTEGGVFLNVYTRNPNNGRGHPYGSKKKKAKVWMPDKSAQA